MNLFKLKAKKKYGDIPQGYIIQVSSASEHQSSEILLIHDDTNSYTTEYAQISTNGFFVKFDSTLAGNNVRLTANSSFDSCSINFTRTLISV